MQNFKNINSASLTKLTNQNRYSNNATLLASDQNAAENDSTLKELLKFTSRKLAFIIRISVSSNSQVQRNLKFRQNIDYINEGRIRNVALSLHLPYRWRTG